MYKLPSIDPAIQYLHGDMGFTTKRTWLKAIQKGNYLFWPFVNVKTSSTKKHKNATPKARTRGLDLPNLQWKRKRKKNKKMRNLKRANTTSLLPSTLCHLPFTPIIPENYRTHPAVEKSTRWSSTRSTPTKHGSNQWRTKPKASSSFPARVPSQRSVSAD